MTICLENRYSFSGWSWIRLTDQEGSEKEVLDGMPHFGCFEWLLTHSIFHRLLFCLMYWSIKWYCRTSLGGFWGYPSGSRVKIKGPNFEPFLTCDFNYPAVHSILHQISCSLFELDPNLYLRTDLGTLLRAMEQTEAEKLKKVDFGGIPSKISFFDSSCDGLLSQPICPWRLDR